MIKVEAKRSNGEVLGVAPIPSGFNPVLRGVDAAKSPVLGSIDPYGDTFFNYLQVKRLLLELDVYQVEIDDYVEFFTDLRMLCDVVLSGPHRFLRFVGD